MDVWRQAPEWPSRRRRGDRVRKYGLSGPCLRSRPSPGRCAGRLCGDSSELGALGPSLSREDDCATGGVRRSNELPTDRYSDHMIVFRIILEYACDMDLGAPVLDVAPAVRGALLQVLARLEQPVTRRQLAAAAGVQEPLKSSCNPTRRPDPWPPPWCLLVRRSPVIFCPHLAVSIGSTTPVVCPSFRYCPSSDITPICDCSKR